MDNLCLLLVTGSLVLFFLRFAVAVDTIDASQPLSDGETIASRGRTFELGFFSPGSSRGRYLGIWYKNIPLRTVVWVANRSNPINDSSGMLMINNTGDIVLLSHKSSVIWSTKTTGQAENPVLQLLDNGNLVLREDNNDGLDTYLWQSFDYPTDTFLPEMKLGWDLKTGLNRQLSSWKSPDDPSPGDFTWGMANRNFPDVVAWKGSDKYFRSGPWNGLRFSGAPQQGSNSIFWYNFVFDGDEIYYMYHVTNKSVLVRSVLNQTNYLWERSMWSEVTQSWRLFLTVPKDYCDTYGICGAYSKCMSNQLPYCQCLKGFTPKSPDEWNSTDWSQGCVRNKPLNCSTRDSDGFIKYSNMKLPDTTHCLVDSTLSLEDCRTKCLNNCSCIAYANSDIRGQGSGCAMWLGDLIDMRQYPDAGQVLYVRMPASEIGQESERPDDDLELPLFDLRTITESTNDFSMRNKLGEGGFGPVYKGILVDGREIAVKRLSSRSRQGLREFKNEVKLIAKLQHRNLVKLLGCCIQGDEKMLIYEYMPNRSLDAFIFDKERSKLLDWHKRFNIICGVARGLLYLHQDSRLRIIHRDLKASNVLLDNEMNPKISDFGMARIFGGDETEGNTNRVVGTYGYMAPEYAIDGLFSVKSDVFSFGILVLETVSGKRNRGLYHSNQSLVWESYQAGKSSELIDPCLADTSNLSQVLRCVHIGLLCLQEHPEDRPSMSSVVTMLSSDNSLAVPQQPGFLVERNPHRGNSSSGVDSSVVNEITFTLLEAR
ncbi:hypothetical protein EUGRSUZ_F01024 [Eucalyptus grandis]|uniref:Uncharacterized protein n=2 Tax=Eucalyptus grandis TaxID=71139 RepID=A0ACC3KD88_EUCGR|nr:hypothetical protein EUGRSUZ_F01024 [Eucalyptus grandis]